MSVKDTLFKCLQYGTDNYADYTLFDDVSLPDWLEPEVIDNGSTIKSYVWRTDWLRRIRLTELNLQGKFIAESLVMYPDVTKVNPIFGTEFVNAGDKRFFGTIDFHPLKNEYWYIDKYINEWLGDQPNRTKNKSNIYDLNKFFSKKLWIKSETSDFYEEYLEKLELYLKRYFKMMAKPHREYSYEEQCAYDKHLAGTDPAYGILKNYYSEEFADKYINTFLFDSAKR
jgi:hypothetical protein|tara:strand:- start:262 stop:942 length:681 start_codon:yes stop_codon:yes gene_type:complete